MSVDHGVLQWVVLFKKNKAYTYWRAEVVADLVGQSDVRHGGRDVFTVIQKCHNAGVQAFQTAPVVLRTKQRNIARLILPLDDDAVMQL